jgi:hypothetical protein
VRPARVEVHIEELVLHDFPPLDRSVFAEAVQLELSVLLASRPLEGPATHLDRIDAGRFDVAARFGPDALGAGVAGRVREALG